MPAEADLAARQRALIEALVAGGVIPAGMDPVRVRLTATALRRKRARAAVQHWPALRTVPDFEDRFVAWAERRPPAPGAEEGAAFATGLGGDRPVAIGVELVASRRRRLVRVHAGVVARLFGVRVLSRRSPGGLTNGR